MSKKHGGWGLPPSQRGRGEGGGDPRRLPPPSVTSPDAGADPTRFTPADVRGVTMNPVYAGVGPYPRIVSDEQWVAGNRRILAQDGAEQYLVNLLYLLHRTFRIEEWGGDLPPDAN